MRKFLMAAAFVFVAGCGEQTDEGAIDSTAAAAAESVENTVEAMADSANALMDSAGAIVDSMQHMVGDSAH